MNDVERVKTMRRELAREAAERYPSRTAARDAKLAEVQKHGVMVAAGRAGIIRAGHMTVAEGRTLEAITGEREEDERIWGSMIKQAIKRRNPGFNERAYGFRSFNDLLLEAQKRGLLKLEADEKSGGCTVRAVE